MQPADFYKGKQAALKELQHDLSKIIEKADSFRLMEYETTNRPDTAVYTKLIEAMIKAKMKLDFPLGNVERMMNETK